MTWRSKDASSKTGGPVRTDFRQMQPAKPSMEGSDRIMYNVQSSSRALGGRLETLDGPAGSMQEKDNYEKYSLQRFQTGLQFFIKQRLDLRAILAMQSIALPSSS